MRLARVLAPCGLVMMIVACAAPAVPSPAPPSPTAAPPSPTAAPPSPTAAAPSPTTSEEQPLFATIQRGATQQYFIEEQDGFVERIESLGGRALKFDAREDLNLAVSLVQDAASAGARGIAVSVADQSIGPSIAQAAREAGMVLVATDTDIVDDLGEAVPFVGFDNRQMGMRVGVDAARLLQEAGWLGDATKTVGILSLETSTISVCKDRTDAASEEMIQAGSPADSIIVVPLNIPATIDAQEAVSPVITAHPEVTNWVIYGCNDESALGALNALATQGVNVEDVIAVGLGAYEACKFWAEGASTGFRSALYVSGTATGQAAAQALWDNVVNDVPLPATTIADTTMVTPDTWQDVFECAQ